MTTSNITLVTAVTPSHFKKLQWCMPTWKIKPQFQNCPLIIYFHGFGDFGKIALFGWLEEVWPEATVFEWNMPHAANDRERMISAFVFGAAEHVKTEYCVKLDADCYFTDDQDVFDLSDFEHDIVAHTWGYTKPGWWLDELAAWSRGEGHISSFSNEKHGKTKHPRIQSFCCLHKTEFVREAARLAGDRLPVPSHDTYLWWLAHNVKEFSWSSKKMHRVGVGHSAREKKVREGVCASVGIEIDTIANKLYNNIQLEITSACNLACPNCDRNCGEARTGERMTLGQVELAVKEWLDLGRRFSRVDILGGEPTLHPELFEILDVIKRYKDETGCKVRLTTNGTGNHVTEIIAKLPAWLKIRNSANEKINPNFEAVNMAPIDQGVKNAQACSIPWRCGLALNRYGYYLCGAGAGICRVFGLKTQARTLKDLTLTELRRQKDMLCKLCGHSRSTVKLTTEREISPTWETAFESYRERPPQLEVM